jgi:hypothetical protein
LWISTQARVSAIRDFLHPEPGRARVPGSAPKRMDDLLRDFLTESNENLPGSTSEIVELEKTPGDLCC